eukprot:scaffold405952_cov24-Attheya_sp.AAC.2
MGCGRCATVTWAVATDEEMEVATILPKAFLVLIRTSTRRRTGHATVLGGTRYEATEFEVTVTYVHRHLAAAASGGISNGSF